MYVEGITAEYVTSEEEMFNLMVEAQSNRKTAATGMNEGSSRSHSVSIITVTQKNTNTKVRVFMSRCAVAALVVGR